MEIGCGAKRLLSIVECILTEFKKGVGEENNWIKKRNYSFNHMCSVLKSKIARGLSVSSGMNTKLECKFRDEF